MRVNPSKYWPSKLSVKKWKCQSSYKPVFNMHNSVTFSTVHQIKRCKMINWKGKLWSDVVAKIYPKFILISVQRESIVNIQHVPWPLIQEYHNDGEKLITFRRKINTVADLSQADWGRNTAIIKCRFLPLIKANFHWEFPTVRTVMFT